jgi:alkaline phosphatase
MRRFVLVIGLVAVLAASLVFIGRILRSRPGPARPKAKYVIVMIGDGMGAKHMEAAERYFHARAPYVAWPRAWMATAPAGGSYDPVRAWSDFGYLTQDPADSASAATAMFTGIKTANGRISVSADGRERLWGLSEEARAGGLAAGAVSTVEISDATPGAWIAHNDDRGNGLAIADEGFWGDPEATGTVKDSPFYGGGHGPTRPPFDVLIGAGHPGWYQGRMMNPAIRDRLFRDSGRAGAFYFVERLAGRKDAGRRLLGLADRPAVTRLAGLFGGKAGHLEDRLADGSGLDPEDPTLAEMTLAALDVLVRNPAGFVLLVEGGSIDLASHDGNMDRMLGAVIDFYEAVHAVEAWVDDPSNAAAWDNTLVVVTADHETGFLTAGPGFFADRPLGPVDAGTLALERPVAGTELRASWEDQNHNDKIDPGENVYWSWNSTGHTNSLVPLYGRGAGSASFMLPTGDRDPVRGPYIQNTEIFRVAKSLVSGVPIEAGRPAVTARH